MNEILSPTPPTPDNQATAAGAATEASAAIDWDSLLQAIEAARKDGTQEICFITPNVLNDLPPEMISPPEDFQVPKDFQVTEDFLDRLAQTDPRAAAALQQALAELKQQTGTQTPLHELIAKYLR